jgi:hypothetical protein
MYTGCRARLSGSYRSVVSRNQCRNWHLICDWITLKINITRDACEHVFQTFMNRGRGDLGHLVPQQGGESYGNSAKTGVR